LLISHYFRPILKSNFSWVKGFDRYMIKKKIILARHGQTVGNRDSLVLGQSHSPLTEEGLECAKRMAAILKSEGPQMVFSSSLERALTTARTFAKELGLPVDPRVELVELSCGLWEGRPRKSVTNDVFSIRNAWDFRPPQGESYADGERRLARFLSELAADYLPATILVVGHASINRVFLKMMLNLPPEEAMLVSVPHDYIYIIEEGKVGHKSVSGVVREGLIMHRPAGA
jgi:probable phosphoglycerate mutase